MHNAKENWYKSFFLLKYEDYVDNKLEAASDYLGMSISNSPVLPNDLMRVKRTKSKSDWKNWFTDTDIDFFKKAFEQMMIMFGYEDN